MSLFHRSVWWLISMTHLLDLKCIYSNKTTSGLFPVYEKTSSLSRDRLKPQIFGIGKCFKIELNFYFRFPAHFWSYPQLLENFFGPPPSSQPLDRLWPLSLDFHSMPPSSFLVSLTDFSFFSKVDQNMAKWIKILTDYFSNNLRSLHSFWWFVCSRLYWCSTTCLNYRRSFYGYSKYNDFWICRHRIDDERNHERNYKCMEWTWMDGRN